MTHFLGCVLEEFSSSSCYSCRTKKNTSTSFQDWDSVVRRGSECDFCWGLAMKAAYLHPAASRELLRGSATHCVWCLEKHSQKNKMQKIWSQQTHTSHKALRNPPGFNYNQYTKIMWQDKTGTWNVHGFVSAPNKHTAQVKVFLLVLISGTSLWCQSTLSPKRD